MAVFWPPWAPGAHIHIYSQNIHTHKLKFSFKKKGENPNLLVFYMTLTFQFWELTLSQLVAKSELDVGLLV